MITIGAYEAKTRFSQLLQQVSKGETIEITRRGKTIARLVPSILEKPNIAKAIKEMEEFQKNGPTLGPGLTIKQMIEEGRR